MPPFSIHDASQQEHQHQHLQIEVTGPVDVMRFEAVHGRAPTEQELAEMKRTRDKNRTSCNEPVRRIKGWGSIGIARATQFPREAFHFLIDIPIVAG